MGRRYWLWGNGVNHLFKGYLTSWQDEGIGIRGVHMLVRDLSVRVVL